ncbi:TPA: uberolysin/carnocyclin family circular bacteriocin [Enterococcus faecium]|nr:uberolysin/carnocyclin family circular bacteriocin [Enterococcus faecium]
MKKNLLLVLPILGFAGFFVGVPMLSANIGISSYAAKKVIDIINTGSTVATIISIVAAVVGGGLITAGIVTTAKSLIKKYGAKYAAAW